MPVQRRIGTIVVAGLLTALVACGAPTTNKPAAESTGDVPDKPSKAVTLNILDVAGNLQLTQPMIDDFVQQHHDVISKVTYSKAPAPELSGKIKAQQNANRVDIDLVLTGTDGLAAGQRRDGRDVHGDDAGIAGGGPALRQPHATRGPCEGRATRVKEDL